MNSRLLYLLFFIFIFPFIYFEFSNGQIPKILKGGFKTFETPEPESVEECENRKVELREKLWQLLGDLPPLFTSDAKIRKKEKRDGYSPESFAFDNGIGHTVYGYISIPTGHKGRGYSIYYYVLNMLKEKIDAESVVGLIAPRAHLTLTGDQDGASPVDGVRIINTFQEHLYKLHGKEENFRCVIYPSAGHVYTRET